MSKFDINLAELQSIRLSSSSFQVLDEDHLFEGGSIRFLCELTLFDDDKSKDNTPLEGKCSVNVRAIKPETKDQPLFEADYNYIVFFNVINHEVLFNLENRQRADYCLEKIYPLIREDLMSCFDRAGLRQIYLPFSFKVDED
ncbi:hypothetical protein ABNJ92_000351 [Vibrio parahaemolyticus]|uniref:Preprotein translocase subunit SecB n=1 Tax=Vibrio alginolyticus TaxID=663 RepID=A0A7Y0R1B3_VIBAL|nr:MULTISPECIES: hypothetical protein [Vibrio]EIO4602617.1 hypothetical protein [Vibrio parahaemolyticus]GAK17375.1 hypothetical protein JCM19053_2553 [Vibrio sp. JCM 19053]MCR9924949.1 hypothetical protein [Vibrio alginolyticus]MDW2204561.1 hypothetical protein [Vibrio sp. 1636]NMR76495.1 hypothetical protein [Vibrio alginolyticus]